MRGVITSSLKHSLSSNLYPFRLHGAGVMPGPMQSFEVMPTTPHENIVRSHEHHFRKHLKENNSGPLFDSPESPPTNDLFEVDFGDRNWHKFDYSKFRSWSGDRRINRKLYFGRTYYTMSTKISRPTELSHA